MEKKILYRLYSGAFIAMCLVPSVLMPFIKTDEAKEKRKLAEAPKIRTEDGRLNDKYFSQFEDWFSEHFAFRQALVTADGRLKTAAFGTSPNKNVIYGSNGWLYYGETADNYLRLNKLTAHEICNIVRNLEMMKDYCTAQGADFLFTVAPNKNTVYPENMPSNYVPAEGRSDLESLTNMLSGSGYYCDMKEVLLSAGSSIPLYHLTDTHWNNMGAYVGYTGLMKALGRDYISCGGWTSRNDRLGDLAAMIYPAEEAKDRQVYTDYPFTYSYLGHFRALDDIDIRTTSENGQGSLLMFRDSYGEAILQYMAETYSSASFTRAVPYPMTGIGGEDGADTVILEIVERNLGNLQKYAPLMAAPETALPENPASVYAGRFSEKENQNIIDWTEFTVKAEPSGQYTHIYGELPYFFFRGGDEHRILVTAGGRTFEAFLCFEDKLLGREGERSANGFSLYLPQDVTYTDLTMTVLNSGDTDISVTIPEDQINRKDDT